MRCPDKGDIRMFLSELRCRKAELEARWLASYASNQLSAARLHSSLQHTIDPDILIILISDEWDRTRPDRSRGGATKAESDDALMVVGNKGGGGGGNNGGGGKFKGKAKKKGPCWICGGDHWKRECPRKGASANIVTEDDDDDCSFMVEELSDYESDSSWSELEADHLNSVLESDEGITSEIDFGSDFEEVNIDYSLPRSFFHLQIHSPSTLACKWCRFVPTPPE